MGTSLWEGSVLMFRIILVWIQVPEVEETKDVACGKVKRKKRFFSKAGPRKRG